MNRKQLSELLGYMPGAELKRKILDDVRTTGKSIEECADAYAMPPLVICNADGTFKYHGETMTAEIFTARYPHRRFITIKEQQND